MVQQAPSLIEISGTPASVQAVLPQLVRKPAEADDDF